MPAAVLPGYRMAGRNGSGYILRLCGLLITGLLRAGRYRPVDVVADC